MPAEQQQFDSHAALERDIARLSREIGKRREAPELKGAEGKELLRQSLRALTPPLPAGEPPAGAAPAPKEEDALLPSYMKSAPAEAKLRVEELLELSLHKGVEHGLKEARKAGPYLLDAFHDALIDKLYPELKKRGIVE